MKKRIPYLNKDVKKSTDQITELKWYSEKVGVLYFKTYYEAIPVLKNISKIARSVLDFACMEMEIDNVIINDLKFKSNFNKKKRVRQ